MHNINPDVNKGGCQPGDGNLCRYEEHFPIRTGGIDSMLYTWIAETDVGRFLNWRVTHAFICCAY